MVSFNFRQNSVFSQYLINGFILFNHNTYINITNQTNDMCILHYCTTVMSKYTYKMN